MNRIHETLETEHCRWRLNTFFVYPLRRFGIIFRTIFRYSEWRLDAHQQQSAISLRSESTTQTRAVQIHHLPLFL